MYMLPKVKNIMKSSHCMLIFIFVIKYMKLKHSPFLIMLHDLRAYMPQTNECVVCLLYSERNKRRIICVRWGEAVVFSGNIKRLLSPAYRRGASLSRAMRGGSSNTLSSFSVTIPWYVVSIHGLCLLTVRNTKETSEDAKSVPRYPFFLQHMWSTENEHCLMPVSYL